MSDEGGSQGSHVHREQDPTESEADNARVSIAPRPEIEPYAVTSGLPGGGQGAKSGDENLRQRDGVLRFGWRRGVGRARRHPIPRCCLASGVIMSGVQGGS